MPTGVYKRKKRGFECQECGTSFETGDNAHPKRCPKCRKKNQKKHGREYYEKNKELVLKRAFISQRGFIEKYGISRQSLIRHEMTVEEYQEKRKSGCYVCGFREVLDIHRVVFGSNGHLELLCPNHHAMVHRIGYIIKTRKEGE